MAGLAGTALAAVVPLGKARLGAAEGQSIRFAPPPGPLLFSRSLVRMLADGKAVTVTRHWQIGFVPQGRGWAVTGAAAGVEVAAPPALAAFARIERERAGPGPFPLLLDAAGAVAAEAEAADPAALDRALALARGQIAAAPLDGDGRAGSVQFLETLAAASGSVLTAMPADLFFPQPLERSEERTIDLPGGQRGRIELTFAARLAEGDTILREAHRSITTIIGDERRESREAWTLAPA